MHHVACIYMCVYVCVYMYVCVYVCVWMYACMCVCVCICVCMYVCMYILMCVYLVALQSPVEDVQVLHLELIKKHKLFNGLSRIIFNLLSTCFVDVEI